MVLVNIRGSSAKDEGFGPGLDSVENPVEVEMHAPLHSTVRTKMSLREEILGPNSNR